MVDYYKQNPNLGLQELIAQGKEAFPEFKEIVHNIFSDLKGAHPDLFSNAVVEIGEKDENRIIEKVKGDYKGVCSDITDIIRGRIIVGPLEEVQIVRDYAQKMSDEYDVTSLKDRFATPTGSGFRDVNMTIRLSNDHVAEFRFEQEDMVEYGKMTHYIYEKSQEIERAAIGEAEKNGYPTPRYTPEQREELKTNDTVNNYLHQVGADIVDQDACLDEASKKRILEAHLQGAALEIGTPDANKKIHELVEEAKEAVRLKEEKAALEKQQEAESRLEILTQEAAEARALADQKAAELEQAQSLADEKAQIAEQTATAAAARIERLEYSTQLLKDEMEELPPNEAAVNARDCEVNQTEIAELNAEIARTAAEAEAAREIVENIIPEQQQAEAEALAAEEARKEEEARQQAEEERKKEEEQKALEEQRSQEEARQAEEAKKAEEAVQQKEEEARLAAEEAQQKEEEARVAEEIAEQKEAEALEAKEIAEQKAQEAIDAEEIALETEGEAKQAEEVAKQANEEEQGSKEALEAEALAKQKAIEAEEAKIEAEQKAEEAKKAEEFAQQKAEEALEAKENAALKAEEAQQAEVVAEEKAKEAEQAKAELVEEAAVDSVEKQAEAAAKEITSHQSEQTSQQPEFSNNVEQSEENTQQNTLENGQSADVIADQSDAVENAAPATMVETTVAQAVQENAPENTVPEGVDLAEDKAEQTSGTSHEEGTAETTPSNGKSINGRSESKEDPPVAIDKNEVSETIEIEADEEEPPSFEHKPTEKIEEPATQQTVELAVIEAAATAAAIETSTSTSPETTQESTKDDFTTAAFQVTSIDMGGGGGGMCFRQHPCLDRILCRLDLW